MTREALNISRSLPLAACPNSSSVLECNTDLPLCIHRLCTWQILVLRHLSLPLRLWHFCRFCWPLNTPSHPGCETSKAIHNSLIKSIDVCYMLPHGACPHTLLYKLGWVGKNGRPKWHTQGVTPVTGDAKNAFRKKIWWENLDWSLYFWFDEVVAVFKGWIFHH